MNGILRTGGWLLSGVVVALIAWAPATHAQPGDNQNREPAWKALAESVGKSLNLNEEQTKSVVNAYVASRKKLDAEQENATGEGRARFEAMMEAAEKERASLKTALSATLTPEQVETAMKTLGGYGRQIDRMVATILDMKLDADVQQKALVHIQEYAGEVNGIRERSTDRGDWESMRTVMQSAKTKLDEALGKVLSESQMAKWNEETAWRGRGGRRGPGGEGGGQPGTRRGGNESSGQ